MCQRKEEEAWFEKMRQTFLQPIKRYAYHLFRDREEADDATVKAFQALWWLREDKDKMKWEDQQIGQYLRVTVLHDYCKWAKKKQKFPTGSTDAPTEREESRIDAMPATDPGTDPLKVVERKATSRAVKECIEKLPQEKREVVERYYFQELDHEQIAAELNIPVNTVHSRMWAARKKLECCLKQKEIFS